MRVIVGSCVQGIAYPSMGELVAWKVSVAMRVNGLKLVAVSSCAACCSMMHMELGVLK